MTHISRRIALGLGLAGVATVLAQPVTAAPKARLKRFGINLRQKIILKRSDKPIWCTRFDFM
ncbi:hypothetical protein [Halovulum sp. GXIMD14793]